MTLVNKQLKYTNWGNVGVFPTPGNIVDDFANFTIDNLNGKFKDLQNITILDVFSGDGRLGANLEKKLNSIGITSKVTFIEILENVIKSIPNKRNYKTIRENVFCYEPTSKYDLVVCNPPYLVLDATKSKHLGLDWNVVKGYSKNLYGLSILKSLELCKEGGILAVIAPFGYLMGAHSAKLRMEIESQCSQVMIRAEEMRNLFEAVNQDIGLQLFLKRNLETKNTTTNWKFGYNGFPLETLPNKNGLSEPNHLGHLKVRVGPIVWNRSRDFLCSSKVRDATLLVYGGNIRPGGKLDFEVKKYSHKQYIRTYQITEKVLIKPPAIVIRRTLRGRPGQWIVDSAILKKEKNCTGENHIIIVEIPKSISSHLHEINEQLIRKIERHYYISGSPSLSVRLVRQIAYEIIKLKTQSGRLTSAVEG